MFQPIELPVIFNGIMMASSDIPFKTIQRAFRFGDSWFESMRYVNDEIALWNFHKDRLIRTFPAVNSVIDQIPVFIKNYANQLGKDSLRIRLTIFRTDGQFYSAVSDSFSYLVEFAELLPIDYKNSTIDFAKTVVIPSNRYYPGKSGNSAPYILAEKERIELGLTQIILLNEKGEIAETSNANIFWRKGSTWFTPSLNSGCVDGVMRRHFLDMLNRQAVVCEEVLVSASELENCDEICVSNAIIGVKNIHLFHNKALQLNGEKIFNETEVTST